MLAFLGVLVQEFVHLPAPQFSNPVATEAFFQVPAGGLWQIFLACGLVEFVSHRGKLSYSDMFDGGREPGNFGFEYVLCLTCSRSCVDVYPLCVGSLGCVLVSRGFETLTFCAGCVLMFSFPPWYPLTARLTCTRGPRPRRRSWSWLRSRTAALR